MKCIALLFSTGVLTVFFGCAHTWVERKQSRVLDCVKELKEYEASTEAAFNVCRQIYGLKEEN